MGPAKNFQAIGGHGQKETRHKASYFAQTSTPMLSLRWPRLFGKHGRSTRVDSRAEQAAQNAGSSPSATPAAAAQGRGHRGPHNPLSALSAPGCAFPTPAAADTAVHIRSIAHGEPVWRMAGFPHDSTIARPGIPHTIMYCIGIRQAAPGKYNPRGSTLSLSQASPSWPHNISLISATVGGSAARRRSRPRPHRADRIIYV